MSCCWKISMFVYTKIASDTDSVLCLVCPFVKLCCCSINLKLVVCWMQTGNYDVLVALSDAELVGKLTFGKWCFCGPWLLLEGILKNAMISWVISASLVAFLGQSAFIVGLCLWGPLATWGYFFMQIAKGQNTNRIRCAKGVFVVAHQERDSQISFIQ